jgi:GTPase Era involved in 16S rRNA processing
MDETTEPSPNLVPDPRKRGGTADELKHLMSRVRSLCEESGEGFSDSLARIAELQERLAEERFHLAILGQFKRGKSSLLNAILGAPLLPTGVVPLTSIPTFLRAGQRRSVRVLFHDGRESAFPDLTLEEARDILARHVTEKENPGNRLGVESVEVEHPAAILMSGVVLIDTPGIGSTFHHNTDATLRFLPQCDAALFIVSADPPITEVEKEFLKAVQDKVEKLCFVMNKVDYLTEAELADATLFFKKVLKELGLKDSGTVFKVSARNGIDARVKKDPALWRKSGLEDLQNYLLDFVSREKSRTLQLALARKALAVVADVSMHVKLQQRSLQLSREELERRIEAFDRKVKELAQEKIKIGDLLAGDSKRTVQVLEDLAERLRRDARQYLQEIISAAFENSGSPAAMEEQARAALAEEIPMYFQANLTLFSNKLEKALREALLPHQERLETLIGTLRSIAAELFDIPYRPNANGTRLERAHKPYWVTQKWNTTVSPVPEGFFGRFLLPAAQKRRLQKRLLEEVQTLVTHNVENIRWSTLRNLDETFRNFSTTLDERIRETADATRKAMRATDLRKKQSEEAAQPELKRLKQKAADLADLENSLSQYTELL